MSWRIKSITIKNFKFFAAPFTLDVDGANVLLFGENGAGKSSIFWSAFTHYQAQTKSAADAVKYFTAGNPENLRNRFCDADADSGITITFMDENGNTQSFEDSLSYFYAANTQARDFMWATFLTSDFLNYKMISKMFEFNNSQENDVFAIFEKEFFQILNFDSELYDIHEQSLHTKNVDDWWKYLNKYDAILPHNAKNTNTFNLSAPEYREYEKLLSRFNYAMRLLLRLIQTRANAIIQEKFKIPVELLLEYQGAKFNESIRSRVRTGKLSSPKILLHSRLKSDAVKDASVIRHSKSFFNEAKLTCMGIALRLAVLEQRSPVPEASAAIFLDDLLISLDMSVRRLVVPIILEYAEKWQLLIFTHDRSLFYIYREEISHRGQLLKWKHKCEVEEAEITGNTVADLKLPKWKKFELYSQDNNDGIPAPLFFESQTHLSRAKANLACCKIPECANALRQCCEEQVKRILPKHMQYQVAGEERRVEKEFKSLLDAFHSFVVKECRITPLADAYSKIDMQRKLVLNPFSHDDLDTPFYREELARLIDLMSILSSVEIEKAVSLDTEADKDKVHEIKLSKHDEAGNLKEASAKFCFLSPCYIISLDGKRYTNSPSVLVKEVSGCEDNILKVDKALPVKKVYMRLYHAMSPIRKEEMADIIDRLR